MTKKNEVKIYVSLTYFILLLFASFRFGFGNDYFNYYNYYTFFPNNFFDNSLKHILSSGIEPGFILLSVLFKSFDFSFGYFIGFCSFVSLTLVLYTIQKYSSYKSFSILIFFANYYLVYVENLLRQGIAMAIFFYVFYDIIITGNKKKYYLLILLGSTIHISLIIALCVPILLKLNIKIFLNPIIIVIVLMLALTSSFFSPYIILSVSQIIFKKGAYYIHYSINYLALGLRFLEVTIIYYIFIRTYEKLSRVEILSVKMFIIGVVIYSMVSSMSILSRMTDYFSFLEVILIPNLISYLKPKEKKMYRAMFSCVFIILFLKDMYSTINLMNIKSKQIIDYPYITIFNKEKFDRIVQPQ
jgi:hypothetical protein